MRLTDTKIQALTDKLVATLSEHRQVTLKGSASQVAFRIRMGITEDLRREDALEEEVRQLLERHLRGRSRMSLDYQTLFKKAKAQLVRDRKLVI